MVLLHRCVVRGKSWLWKSATSLFFFFSPLFFSIFLFCFSCIFCMVSTSFLLYICRMCGVVTYPYLPYATSCNHCTRGTGIGTGTKGKAAKKKNPLKEEKKVSFWISCPCRGGFFPLTFVMNCIGNSKTTLCRTVSRVCIAITKGNQVVFLTEAGVGGLRYLTRAPCGDLEVVRFVCVFFFLTVRPELALPHLGVLGAACKDVHVNPSEKVRPHCLLQHGTPREMS